MSKRWCFTVNNPEQWRPVWKPDVMDYLVWQLERGEAGTPHVQGYVVLKKRCRLNAAKEALGSNEAHMEQARGSEQQNKEYCTKAETRLEGPFEFGTFDPCRGKQGSRSDLTAVAQALKSGTPIRTVALENPEVFMKYPGGVERLAQLAQPPVPLERDIHITVLWGETGTGKSHRVHHALNPDEVYVVLAGRNPWDMYQGQPIIYFEDWDYLQWPISDMKRYLDKWRLQLPCRYANKEARWTSIYISTNQDPETWYMMGTTATPLDRAAIQRRLAPPVGKVFQVLSQQQEISLTWWQDVSAAVTIPAPRASAAPQATAPMTPPLPDSSGSPNPRPLKRTRACPDLATVDLTVDDDDLAFL